MFLFHTITSYFSFILTTHSTQKNGLCVLFLQFYSMCVFVLQNFLSKCFLSISYNITSFTTPHYLKSILDIHSKTKREKKKKLKTISPKTSLLTLFEYRIHVYEMRVKEKRDETNRNFFFHFIFYFLFLVL